MQFRELKVKQWLLKLAERIAYRTATPIQEKAIPLLLQGNSLAMLAQTGSGKTAAFGFPLLHQLSDRPFGIFAVIIVPNRQLALQIQEKMQVYGESMNLRMALLIGGTNYLKNLDQLARVPHILVGTPGRIQELLETKACPSLCQYIVNARYLVLDEADQLLEPSLLPSVIAIVQSLPNLKQTVLSSATLDCVQNLQQLALSLGLQTQLKQVSTLGKQRTVPTLIQEYVMTAGVVKQHYFFHLLKENTGIRTIVFVATCKECQLIYLALKHMSYSVACLHSSMKQVKRMANLAKFRSGAALILVTTDASARGLDIPQVRLVVNHSLPKNAVDYVHRVGRTARAGKEGCSVSLLRPEDIPRLHAIEEYTGVEMIELQLREEEVLKEAKGVMKALKEAKIYMLESGITERMDHLQKRKLEQKMISKRRSLEINDR